MSWRQRLTATSTLVVIATLLVVVALTVGGVIFLAGATSETAPTAPVYTVAQVATGVVRAPRVWVGRSVHVHGVLLLSYGISGFDRSGVSSHWGPGPVLVAGAAVFAGQERNTSLLFIQPTPPDLFTQTRTGLARTFHLRSGSSGAAPTRGALIPTLPRPAIYTVRVLGQTGCPSTLIPRCIAVTLTTTSAP